MLKFSTLEYFVAVATEKSFTKAAAKLYLSQPTLSRRIGELESELGVKLFDRQPHSLTLTSAGNKFLTEATIVLDQVDRLTHLFDHEADEETSGVVRIGYLPNFNLAKMYRALNIFKQDHPKAQYLLSQAVPTDLVNGLESGTYDIVLNLATYLQPIADIVQADFLPNHLQLAMLLDHPLSQHKNITFKYLRDETFILLERQQSPIIVDYVVNQGLQNGFNLKANTYVKNLDEGMSMVALGKGIAFLYSGMNDDTLEAKYHIKIVDLSIPNQDQDIVVARMADTPNRQAQQLFELFSQL